MEINSAFLSVMDVLRYLDATTDSRSFVEGEHVLNANHIICCGVTKQHSDYVDLLSLCLQTSGVLTHKPHEIMGKLRWKDNQLEINTFSCSCKAGQSGKCKHIAATLLYCTRSKIAELEKLSSTDVACYWKVKRKDVEGMYAAKPIVETNCVQKLMEKTYYAPSLGNQTKEKVLGLLLDASPTSGLAKHKQGRRNVSENVNICGSSADDTRDEFLTSLKENIANSSFLPSLNLQTHLTGLKECCREFYKSLEVDGTENTVTAVYGSREWKNMRKWRLTGSRCYSIFTFRKIDWESKARKYFSPKEFSNVFTRHGIEQEPKALECYKKITNGEIYQPGFIVCQQYPWLGYSADGILCQEGKPIKLIEIKCPYIGKTEPSSTFLSSCTFLQNDGCISLKTRHAYYAQVQLGMAILNIAMCDFIVYSSCENNFLKIEVPFDPMFAKTLMSTISEKYFVNMISFACGCK